MDLTEDDTFNTLRRIPMVEIEKRIGDQLVDLLRMQLKSLRYRYLDSERAYARSEYMRRWIPFYPLPSSHSHLIPQDIVLRIGVMINGVGWDHFFDNTGWTADEYVFELNRVFDREYAEEIEKKRISKRNKIIGAIASGAVAGLACWILLPLASAWLAWLGSFVAGMGTGVILNKKVIPF